MEQASFNYYKESMDCKCGQTIDVSDFCYSLKDELDSNWTTSIEDKEEYTCSNCYRVYKITLGLSLQVSVDLENIEEIGREYYDKDEQLVSIDYFKNLELGQEVNLWDGQYELGGMTYRVLDGKLLYVLSSLTDENQLNLFEVQEVIS